MKYLFLLTLAVISQTVLGNECYRAHDVLGEAISDYKQGFLCQREEKGSFSPPLGDYKFKSGQICLLYNKSKKSILLSGKGRAVESYFIKGVGSILTKLSRPSSFVMTFSQHLGSNIFEKIFPSPYSGGLSSRDYVLPGLENREKRAFLFSRREIGPEDLYSYSDPSDENRLYYERSGDLTGEKTLKWEVSENNVRFKYSNEDLFKSSSVIEDFFNAGISRYKRKTSHLELNLVSDRLGRMALDFQFGGFTLVKKFYCTKFNY